MKNETNPTHTANDNGQLLSLEPYLSLIKQAVQDITYPPLSAVKLMFQESKQAQANALSDLVKQRKQAQLEAEQALTAFYVRHQRTRQDVSDYQTAIQQLGEHDDTTKNDK